MEKFPFLRKIFSSFFACGNVSRRRHFILQKNASYDISLICRRKKIPIFIGIKKRADFISYYAPRKKRPNFSPSEMAKGGTCAFCHSPAANLFASARVG